MRQSQTGMALIAVLLFLILITVAGVIAVRQGRVDLKIATSDQADTLMLNSSDSVLAHVEQAASETSSTAYARIMSQSQGVLGYFSTQPEQKEGHQVAFCYQPNESELFKLERARILQYGGGTTVNAGNAICNPNRAGDYVSARGTVMTQVVARGMSGETLDDKPFEHIMQGQTVSTIDGATPRIQIHSVSVIPALSSASDSDIKDCLGYPAGTGAADYGSAGANGNMTKCLKEKGIPATAVVEEGLLVKDMEGGYRNGEVKPNNDICNGDPDCLAALGMTPTPTPTPTP